MSRRRRSYLDQLGAQPTSNLSVASIVFHVPRSFGPPGVVDRSLRRRHDVLVNGSQNGAAQLAGSHGHPDQVPAGPSVERPVKLAEARLAEPAFEHGPEGVEVSP